MRLERLEISGFKSFSERSELAFDRGVTAIVGPNGCGKSNVADAITWVLGEQSAKSLRGEKMEDVIFNGSDARKAGATAEVRPRLGGLPVQPRVASIQCPAYCRPVSFSRNSGRQTQTLKGTRMGTGTAIAMATGIVPSRWLLICWQMNLPGMSRSRGACTDPVKAST